jgi:hypothetical protein
MVILLWSGMRSDAGREERDQLEVGPEGDGAEERAHFGPGQQRRRRSPRMTSTCQMIGWAAIALRTGMRLATSVSAGTSSDTGGRLPWKWMIIWYMVSSSSERADEGEDGQEAAERRSSAERCGDEGEDGERGAEERALDSGHGHLLLVGD